MTIEKNIVVFHILCINHLVVFNNNNNIILSVYLCTTNITVLFHSGNINYSQTMYLIVNFFCIILHPFPRRWRILGLGWRVWGETGLWFVVCKEKDRKYKINKYTNTYTYWYIGVRKSQILGCMEINKTNMIPLCVILQNSLKKILSPCLETSFIIMYMYLSP